MVPWDDDGDQGQESRDGTYRGASREGSSCRSCVIEACTGARIAVPLEAASASRSATSRVSCRTAQHVHNTYAQYAPQQLPSRLYFSLKRLRFSVATGLWSVNLWLQAKSSAISRGSPPITFAYVAPYWSKREATVQNPQPKSIAVRGSV